MEESLEGRMFGCKDVWMEGSLEGKRDARKKEERQDKK